MPSEASLPLAVVYAFLLVLARVAGAIAFVPMPGVSASAAPARIILALSMTIALAPLWPSISGSPGPAQLTGWLLSEAALGVAIGLVVSFLSESFAIFGQAVGLQAGYSFASTIDPNSQADNGVVIVLSQSVSGLLFFTLGLHREVLRAFAASLTTLPPGGFKATPALADAMIRLASTLFSTGLRLALPVIALLVMVDLALALLGRINSQLQLLSLAFPAKMLATLVLLGALAAMFPHVYSSYAERLFAELPGIYGGRP
jgi:flagellar biosynthetic protein FliR